MFEIPLCPLCALCDSVVVLPATLGRRQPTHLMEFQMNQTFQRSNVLLSALLNEPLHLFQEPGGWHVARNSAQLSSVAIEHEDRRQAVNSVLV